MTQGEGASAERGEGSIEHAAAVEQTQVSKNDKKTDASQKKRESKCFDAVWLLVGFFESFMRGTRREVEFCGEKLRFLEERAMLSSILMHEVIRQFGNLFEQWDWRVSESFIYRKVWG